MKERWIAVSALSLAALVCFGESATASPLRAQITNLPQGFKLRPGETVTVDIRVDGGAEGSSRWSLSLQRSGEPSSMVLASGTGIVGNSAVAEVSADALVAGATYTLKLDASDEQASASAQIQFLTTDPSYTLIPLDEGNRSQSVEAIYDIDAGGDRVLYSAGETSPHPVWLLDRPRGTRELLKLAIYDTEGTRLTPGGSQVCFYGLFSHSGLGCVDLSSNSPTLVDSNGSNFYSTDANGSRVVYWGVGTTALQYFLYDTATGMARQLTDDPNAINTQPRDTDCPQQLGTRPFISADGSKVVIITQATLGLVPSDDSIGCRVFVYDVLADEWRQAAALPSSIILDVPALSADGRWLSFVASPRPPTNTSALLLDLQTGTLQDPVIDDEPWPTFDSVVTGNGNGIVISTEADLDPRVGNADHNMDLFYYDFATQDVRQITETVGGIDPISGPCPSYRPAVSDDGGVVVLGGFNILSLEGCHLDGLQRNEREGFIYRFVRAVRRRPGNHAPNFNPVPDQQVLAGDTLTLSMSAQDPDGDPISFFAQVKNGEDVPPGSVMIDHHDGTATFTWPTRPENAGTTLLRVAAYDEGGGELVQDVTITVAASDRPPTASPTVSPTAGIPTATPSAVATPLRCPGDCNGDGRITIDEIVTAVNIALGATELSACPAAACDGPAGVAIACLVRAVAEALAGCI